MCVCVLALATKKRKHSWARIASSDLIGSEMTFDALIQPLSYPTLFTSHTLRELTQMSQHTHNNNNNNNNNNSNNNNDNNIKVVALKKHSSIDNSVLVKSQQQQQQSQQQQQQQQQHIYKMRKNHSKSPKMVEEDILNTGGAAMAVVVAQQNSNYANVSSDPPSPIVMSHENTDTIKIELLQTKSEEFESIEKQIDRNIMNRHQNIKQYGIVSPNVVIHANTHQFCLLSFFFFF